LPVTKAQAERVDRQPFQVPKQDTHLYTHPVQVERGTALCHFMIVGAIAGS
jgi:hypothetical protein